jgi:hypothetical protein
MRSAIASMVGRGWSKTQIKMICAAYANDGINDADIDTLIDTAIDKWQQQQEPPKPLLLPPPPSPRSLDECHKIFRQHFGKTFDLDALDIMLAVAASQKLDGDPVWLLIVSGSGAAKTEMVQTLSGAGAHVTSTITSEGALLSGARKKKNATGGLLRRIGSEGVLVIKDVTSILSMSQEKRAAVLAALREIYDGLWERNVGSEGGQTLTWTGRITSIGAVTTAWDAHHAVVAMMGDRFVLVRIDSVDKATRIASGLQAMDNTGKETKMRPELADAVGGVLANVQGCKIELKKEEAQLVNAANIVTLSRTAVELDYKRDVIDSHAPEMPTRFVKQLMQVVRGSVAVGISREKAMQLAIRCARDSMSPLRSAVLCDVALNPQSSVGEVRKRIGKPWQTTKRTMDALIMIGMLTCDEITEPSMNEGGEKEDGRKKWEYRLADHIDLDALLAMVGLDNPFATESGPS